MEARDIRRMWSASTSSMLDACIRIVTVLRGYKETDADTKREQEFISELVDNGVLSEHDKNVKNKSSKLSKLRKIGESDYLQQKKVRPLLPPSYSTLYEISLLAKDLERKFPKAAEERLVAFLKRHGGDPSTDVLLRERKRLKPKLSQPKPTEVEFRNCRLPRLLNSSQKPSRSTSSSSERMVAQCQNRTPVLRG